MSVAMKVITICRAGGTGVSGRSSHHGVAAQPLVGMASDGAGPNQKNDPAGSRASITANRYAPNVDRGGRMSEPSSPAVIKPALSNSKAHNILGIASIVFSLLLSGCTPPPSLPSPPMRIPFAVHQAGSKVETTFLIRENRTYLFALEYRYEPGNKEKNELIDKLAGRKKRDANGNYVSMLVPIDLRLKLMRISLENGTEQVLHDKEFSEHQPDSKSADSLIRGIAYIPLDIGYYRIDIENLRDAPELAEIAVNFTLIEFYRK